MQDYKDMESRFEIKMGMKEVSFLLVAFFIMIGLAFSLGVVMGKKLFGPVNGTSVAVTQPTTPEPTSTASEPPPTSAPTVSTSPTTTATGEQLTFHDNLRGEPPMPTGSTTPSSPSVTSSPSPTGRPEPINEPEPPATTTPGTTTPPAAPGSRTPTAAHPTTQTHAAPAAPTTPAPTAPAATGSWSIQIGAGSSEQGAKDTVRSLKNKGLDAWFVPVAVKGGTYYRLYVGHYASMEEAQKQMETLKADKKIPADSFIRKS